MSSCGDPSDEYCAGVLSRLYEYIDGELEPAGYDEMRQHLDECAPCLAEHDLEAAIKALMARACGERAPEELRLRILSRISRAGGGAAAVDH